MKEGMSEGNVHLFCPIMIQSSKTLTAQTKETK
jgi:hypothetical protein